MTNEELQSKTINFLRFPLIVGVVLIHTHFNELVINGVELMKGGNLPVYTVSSYLISGIFSAIAVPLFFLISGFLFFHGVATFTGQIYLQKLKKRVRSILIPYFFWNLLVITFFFLSQTFLPGLMSGNNKMICDYSISDWLWAFWNTNMINSLKDIDFGSYPICYQFWFIRDLMVVMIFSPIVYLLVKKLRQYAVLCLGILWGFAWWFDIVGFRSAAFFFFSGGAYFSIHRKSFLALLKPTLPMAVVFYGLIVIAELCFRGQVWCNYLHNIGILVGIVLVIALSARFIEEGKWRVNSFLSDSSFFIYAYHAMPLVLCIKVLLKLLQPRIDGMVLGLYLLCPAVIILIGLALYYLLKKYFPKITSVITGSR